MDPMNGSDPQNGEPMTVYVSNTFYLDADLDHLPTDLVLRSSDAIFFYVHSHTLLASSINAFNFLVPRSKKTVKPLTEVDLIIPLPDKASVLNVLLHTIYGLSCTHYSPPLDDIDTALGIFKTYGIPVHAYMNPTAPLFATIMAHTPTAPLDVYAIAATHNLEDLAVATSAHLHSLSLHSITDEIAEKMGAVYLKRLFFLHLGRVDALKRLLLFPPETHTPTLTCDMAEQRKLTRAWALASAYLAWDARPDMQAFAIRSALQGLSSQLTCDLCKTALTERTNSLIAQWALVKPTI